jgi:hypothetical protein
MESDFLKLRTDNSKLNLPSGVLRANCVVFILTYPLLDGLLYSRVYPRRAASPPQLLSTTFSRLLADDIAGSRSANKQAVCLPSLHQTIAILPIQTSTARVALAAATRACRFISSTNSHITVSHFHTPTMVSPNNTTRIPYNCNTAITRTVI